MTIFVITLLLLCYCTHPKVMTKRAKKSSKLCSTDQRSIRKRNIAYKIHTLTVSPYENYLLGRRVFTLWLVSLGSQMWMMLNLVEIFPKSLKGFTYMISSSMKAFIWKKKKIIAILSVFIISSQACFKVKYDIRFLRNHFN